MDKDTRKLIEDLLSAEVMGDEKPDAPYGERFCQCGSCKDLTTRAIDMVAKMMVDEDLCGAGMLQVAHVIEKISIHLVAAVFLDARLQRGENSLLATIGAFKDVSSIDNEIENAIIDELSPRLGEVTTKTEKAKQELFKRKNGG